MLCNVAGVHSQAQISLNERKNWKKLEGNVKELVGKTRGLGRKAQQAVCIPWWG